MFTDGACSGNPGPGGYGIVLIWNGKHYRREFSKGFEKTTNNRMELMAIVEGLKKIKPKNMAIKIFSDSNYVVEAVNKKWVFGWEKKQFKGKKNSDLWKVFLAYYRHHKITMEWVKGHSGHPENECCDKLARLALMQDKLKCDEGFVNLW
ncbi:ribonuclease H [Elysia marginata]|uniref:ribonuclease H n=1 Tax=Elysia marginata TaxID=1093978 RepID=A0AAV4EY73_9GAST|nr:ribonuclease H [Elysia marginata]